MSSEIEESRWLDALIAYAHEGLTGSAKAALMNRGVRDDQIESFRVGYLWRGLPPLAYPESFVRWWVRHEKDCRRALVFPLTTTLGKVLGVQFRHVDESRKGYIDYFLDKTEAALFGLSEAMPSVWETGEIWLVEGAFDLFPLQRHLPNVVATMHAGISKSFLRILRRLVNRIWLAYDWDSKGRNVSYDLCRKYGKEFSFEIAKFPHNIPYKGRTAKDPGELWEVCGDQRLGVMIQNIKIPHMETRNG